MLLIGLPRSSHAQSPLEFQPTLPAPGEMGPLPSTAPDFQTLVDRALGRVTVPITMSDSGVTLIDTAVVATQIRLRVDAAYNWEEPDRAEFMWAQIGNRGPAQAETAVDYQELSFYGEYAVAERWSFFAELPLRLIDPDVNDNTGGLADGNVGFKFALLQHPDALVTAEFRTIFPSGSGRRGLGNRHVSIEPGLLALYKLGKYLAWEGELRDIVPLNGTPGFAGNILRYGSGITVALWAAEPMRVQTVAELVGWTATGGDVTIYDGPGVYHVSSAAGDTIANTALGVRGTITGRGSLYVGYAHALTGQRWYNDLMRVELRWVF